MGQPKFKPVKQCIFCPAKADSREHVWSDWLLNRLGKNRSVIVGKIQNRDYFDPEQKQIVVKCVCEGCNGGWMKRLEDSVIPILEPMIFDGKHTRLDPLQQWLLAQWAMKTAMVVEYCVRERDTFYTRADCLALSNLTHPTLPSFSYVWIADHDGWENVYTKGTDASGRPGSADIQTAYVTTLSFGRVAMQTLTIRSGTNTDPYSDIECNQHLWSGLLRQIWPATSVVDWPPPNSLKRDMLEMLHRRCSGPQEPIPLNEQPDQ